MQLWQKVWREGFAPQFTPEQINRLKMALEQDSPLLLQGISTSPPPLASVQDWPCEGACAVSMLGWDEDASVGKVEEAFARACYECDRVLGPASCRHFLNWFDETPRGEMRRLFLVELNRENLGLVD